MKKAEPSTTSTHLTQLPGDGTGNSTQKPELGRDIAQWPRPEKPEETEEPSADLDLGHRGCNYDVLRAQSCQERND